MDRTACTEPQCLYKGDVYLFYTYIYISAIDNLLLIYLCNKDHLHLKVAKNKNEQEKYGEKSRSRRSICMGPTNFLEQPYINLAFNASFGKRGSILSCCTVAQDISRMNRKL
jgi:hypothetical protein